MQPTPSTLPRLVLDGACLSAEAALEWEWLCTNGLGGYAFGCLDAGPARRYHGWLVASLSRPRGRHVLVPALDQVLEADGQCLVLGGGAQRPEIAAVPGAWLREFRLEGVLPVWTYEVDGSIVERRVLMPHGRNATLVQWTLLSGPQRPLELRPYLDLRRHDAALPRGGPRMVQAHGGLQDHPVFVGRAGTDGIALHLACSGEGDFEALPQTVRDVLFETERARGYDHVADLHSPGRWRTLLRHGEPVTLAIWVGAEPPRDFETEWRREQDRAAALLARAGAALDVLRRRATVAFEPLDDALEPLHHGAGPERQAELSQELRELERALARLAPEHRDILLLREVENMSYEEIGQVLALEAGTVKSRLARARAALIEHIRRSPA
ncbi:sigma-70 family RNA polymerase sigma factor [Schlegelella aquatica]|uniref:sigma-70 family RNA polymerase sigma factor n=1 Tax=Caldimonas aquatica TaxID=376175 RepID=UPI003752840E